MTQPPKGQNMKNRQKATYLAVIFVTLILAFTCACNRKPQVHDEADGHHGAHGGELPGQSYTSWTAKTQLFMEHQPLIANTETPFAVHFTQLANFKPVASGSATLIFSNQQGQNISFTADKPSIPGIFRPAAKLPTAGKYRLTVKLIEPNLSDTHELGQVEVFVDTAMAKAAAKEESATGVSFLLEQQWKTDFAVQQISVRTIDERIQVAGIVKAPIGKQLSVVSPGAGTVSSLAISAPGVSVAKGQLLAKIHPGTGADIEILSPVSGIISLAQISEGESVEKGWKLFEAIDLSSVWIEARIHETDAKFLHFVSGALVYSPVLDKPVTAARVVSIGASLDYASGTVPITFESENPNGMLRLGSVVSLSLKAGDSKRAVAIPKSAVVDEDGTPVAYVVIGGESFARRPLVIGARDGEWVEIKSGIGAGERVVTQGAYKIRLAAASSQIPAHGHAH